MTAATQSISARISAHLTELQGLDLPDSATALQCEVFRARVDRLSVMIGGLRNLQAVQDAEATERDGVSPLDPRLIMTHLAGASGVGSTAQELAELFGVYQQALLLIQGSPAAPPVAAPVAPPVAPPAAPVATAPRELTDEQAAALLVLMRDEMLRYNVQPTIENVKRTWVNFWRREGRRWGPDTAGWGPQENARDRPAVLTPWP